MATPSTFRRAACTALVAAACFAESSARADATVPRELRYDTTLDVSVTATGAVLWLGSELLLKKALAPSTCRWCEDNALDAGVRSKARWANTGLADTASYVTAFALAPLAAFGLDAALASHHGKIRGLGADALVIAETVILAADVNQLVKFAVGRERPFVHALTADEKSTTSQPSDNNLSFFSGHSTLAFALAASSGTVASMRGYDGAPWVWATGMSIAAVSGYLRIAADRHYLSDVVTGAVVGTALGVGLPWLLHRPATDDASVVRASLSPTRNGTTFTLAGAW
jgi:membrane-associated phospholipid phosphatase